MRHEIIDTQSLRVAVLVRRDKMGLTQEKLAAYIGEDKVSVSTIKRLEQYGLISDNKALIIIQALGLDVSRFLLKKPR